MSPSVKPRRRYDSSQGQEQARQTRWVVLQAARQLFLEDGFAATTMPAIAATAGVSVQTVYKTFGNKPRLAKAVFDVAIAGDDEPVPVSSERYSVGFGTSATRASGFGCTASSSPRSRHAMSPSNSSSATQPVAIPRRRRCGPNSKSNDSTA